MFPHITLQGVTIPYSPPPQPKLKVAQCNQTHCWKVKSISAIRFLRFFILYQYLLFFLILSNKNPQIKKKAHEIALKTCQLLVAFLPPGMDDMVQTQHVN